jgi:hypothetical protein
VIIHSGYGRQFGLVDVSEMSTLQECVVELYREHATYAPDANSFKECSITGGRKN